MVALCAAMVFDAVRKCSFTSETTFPTVSFKLVTFDVASRISSFTSSWTFASCVRLAFFSCTFFISSVSCCTTRFVFESSPVTLASPVSSPQSSSARLLCFVSSAMSFTSRSARAVLIDFDCPSMRSSPRTLR